MKKQGDFWWIGFLALLYLFFWAPAIDVRASLSPGDMGKDLYSFWMTLEGKWPCRDYWWLYGPLMPLYYAFWFLVGGVNLWSANLGVAVLYFLMALSAYRALRLWVSPPLAFLSSLAFLSLEMGWTFNHIGAFPFLFLSLYFLWKFFLTEEVKNSYFGTLALAGLALVKINIGIISFAAFFVSLLGYQLYAKWRGRRASLRWKHFFLLPWVFGVPVLSAYALLYAGLPWEWVNQCFVFKPEFRHFGNSPWTNFKYLVLRFLIWERSRLFWAGGFTILGGLAFLGLRKGRAAGVDSKKIPWVLGSLTLFGLANSAEYLKMEGLIYRFDFWLFPILVLLAGLGGEWASRLFSRNTKRILGALLFFLILWTPFKNLREALAWRVPERYLDLPQGRVYVGGPVTYPSVLNEGVRFIREHTTPGEEILAVPYDPLYCFLSGRRHAVRELIFMEHMRFSEKQEETIIAQMEAKQVPLVLLSNRYQSKEGGVGHFGKTHCQKLAAYISEHYKEARTFGPWGEDELQSHAIKIFLRKNLKR